MFSERRSMGWRCGRGVSVVLSWMADILRFRRSVSVRCVLWLVILIRSALPDCIHVK
jgi:hypothetical protein